MESLLPGLHGAPNIHPMFVHFPIVLWLTALVLWVVAAIRKRDDLWRFGRWLLFAGTLAALVAVSTGFLASDQMGHEAPGHEMVHDHRNFMLVTTALALVVSVLAGVWRRSTSLAKRWVQLALLGVTAVVMTLGADRGARLVFRYGMGTAGEKPPVEHEHDHGDKGADHAGAGHAQPDDGHTH